MATWERYLSVLIILSRRRVQYEDPRGQPAPLGDGFNQPIVIMNVGHWVPCGAAACGMLCCCFGTMPSTVGPHMTKQAPVLPTSTFKPVPFSPAVQEPPGAAARPPGLRTSTALLGLSARLRPGCVAAADSRWGRRRRRGPSCPRVPAAAAVGRPGARPQQRRRCTAAALVGAAGGCTAAAAGKRRGRRAGGRPSRTISAQGCTS